MLDPFQREVEHSESEDFASVFRVGQISTLAIFLFYPTASYKVYLGLTSGEVQRFWSLGILYLAKVALFVSITFGI